jgi:aryl-alcohol dehydrogenase-like predicted oxidoreductase
MTFGDDWGLGSRKNEAQTIYETYREAGGNLIDTANLYTNGTSERAKTSPEKSQRMLDRRRTAP